MFAKIHELKTLIQSQDKKIVILFGIIILLTSIPLTVFIAQKSQDVRQRASAPEYSAYVGQNSAIFSFPPFATDPEPWHGFWISVSNQSNFDSEINYYFGYGVSSPITIGNVTTHWDQYSCGKVFYWRVYTGYYNVPGDGTRSVNTASPVQGPVTVDCSAPPPTPIPTSTPTPSPTTPPSPPSITPTPSESIPTPTPEVPTSSPSATPEPTLTIEPSSTPPPSLTPTPIVCAPFLPPNLVPDETSIAINVVLGGIGPNGGNTDPKNCQKQATLQILDNNDSQVGNDIAVILGFDPASNTFKRIIVAPEEIPAGLYTAKVKVNGYLRKRIPGIISYSPTNPITLLQVTLIAGDVNNDNVINIQDFNLLVTCFEKPVTGNCSPADIDDNGAIDGVDVNLFIKNLSTRTEN